MVSVNRMPEQARLHELWWWGNKSQTGAAACRRLAGLALHVAFGRWELIPAGKAEADSLSWFAQANDCLTHLLLGNGPPQSEDQVQASSWPLGGIWDTTNLAGQLCYEFVVAGIFLQAAIPAEGKLIHQLHSEGRSEKTLTNINKKAAQMMIIDAENFLLNRVPCWTAIESVAVSLINDVCLSVLLPPLLIIHRILFITCHIIHTRGQNVIFSLRKPPWSAGNVIIHIHTYEMNTSAFVMLY